MKFDWDAAKAETNRRKHGVRFEEAEGVLVTPAIFEDLDHSENERRFVAIGLSAKSRWLSVVFTRPEPDTCRIISARKATERERELYVKAKRQAEEGK